MWCSVSFNELNAQSLNVENLPPSFISKFLGVQVLNDTTETRTYPFDLRYFPIYTDSSATDFSSLELTQNKRLSQFSRINQSGSITRGVLVGNTQDASLESGMDLRFSAFLGDSIKVFASLTDQNTPIQPDGSSLQLREFDRVLIGLQSPLFNAELGDVDLRINDHHFLRLNRRVMGVSGSYQSTSELFDSNKTQKVYGGLAALRGEYQVSLLDIREGFSGPYRLEDQNGEPFVIVLAGSEQVFLNGKKLERGADRDYVIDYSFGEIMFTGKHLLKASDRVRVEYQFMSRDYPEILAVAAYDFSANNQLQLSYQLATKRSVDSQTNGTILSDNDRRLLADAGDNFSSIRSLQSRQVVENELNPIRYQAIDTVISGQSLTIYRFDPQGNLNLFFSRVADGEGDYVRDSSNQINGIVYRFAGIGEGNFSPFRQISAPSSLTVQSIELMYSPIKNISIQSSFAQSFEDQNILSSRDDNDNLQLAYNGSIRWKPLPMSSLKLVHQQTASNFQFFDRVRAPEFERDWGIPTDGLFGEKLISLQAVQKTQIGSMIEFEAATLERADYEAKRLNLEGRWQESFLQGRSEYAYLRSGDSRWERFAQEVKLFPTDFKRKTYYLLHELNFEQRKGVFESVQNPNNLALLGSRDFFRELQFGVGLSESDRLLAEVTFGKRLEDIPVSNTINRRRSSNLYSSQLQFTNQSIKSQNRFSWFDVPEAPSFSFYSQQRIQSNNDALRLRLGYEADSRLQGVLNELYTFVGTQFGNYYWEDLNGDGVEQLDEFFPERSPEEGTHILQLLPSENLTGITSVQAAVKMELLFFELFNTKTLIEKAVGPGIEVDIQRKEENRSLEQAKLLRLAPNQMLDDSLTLAGRISSKQQFFWKATPFFVPFRLGHSYLRSLNNRSAFSESARDRSFWAELTFRFEKRLQLILNLERANRERFSPQLLNRNYRIESWKWESEIKKVYSSTNSFAINSEIEWGNGGLGRAFQSYQISNNIRWLLKGGPLNLVGGYRFTRLDEGFSALANFEITGGQGDGSQLFADIRYSRNLGRGIRAELSWSLRTRSESNALQTARFSVNSTF